jgi:hypothetical protein
MGAPLPANDLIADIAAMQIDDPALRMAAATSRALLEAS